MDAHKQTATKVFGCNYEDVTDEQRKFAEAVNYAAWYGSSSYYVNEEMKPYIKAAMKLKGEPNETV